MSRRRERCDSASWAAVTWRVRREWRMERIWECGGWDGGDVEGGDWAVRVQRVTGREVK